MAGQAGPRRGFLLLEMALAMVLISVALVGLLEAFRTAIEARGATDRRTQMALLLENKINELEQAGSFTKGHSEGQFEAPSHFGWEVEVLETPLKSLYKVNVKIEGGGQTALATIFLRPHEEEK